MPEPPGEPPKEPPEEPPAGPPEEPAGGAPEQPPEGPHGHLLGDLSGEPPTEWLEEPIHTPAELAQRRAEERAQRRRLGQQRLLALIIGVVALVVVIVLLTGGSGGSGNSTTTSTVPTGTLAARAGTGPSYLAVGAGNAAVAPPANVLIADRNNNRLLVISPQGQVVLTMAALTPSDAYFSSTGRSVIVTEHLKAVVLRRSVNTGRITYTYGHAGSPGSGTNHLRDPQTGHQIAGQIVIADLGNCRVLFVAPPAHHPVAPVLGSGQCAHNPPTSFAEPDSAFPTPGGGIVVTERNPGWIDVLSKTHTLVGSPIRLTFTQPYDANESKYAPGQLIVADRTRPGALEELDATTHKVTWTYSVKTGDGALNLPTLARVLPNGNILVADSGNDRVIVIDHNSKKIVWQYGHTGKPGSTSGFLHTPGSVDLVP
jgi:hypothetical protein